MYFSSMSPDMRVYLDENENVKFDVLVCSLGGDLAKAKRLSNTIPKFVLDYTNHYLVENSLFKDRFRNLTGSVLHDREYCVQSYKKTILQLMARADLIICPSVTQQNYLKKQDIKSVQLTDFFEQEVREKSLDFVGDGNFFWEGQAGNLRQLRLIAPVIERQSGRSMRIVSDEQFGMFGGRLLVRDSRKYCNKLFSNLEFLEWTVDNVNLAARKSSLGVIPLDLSDKFVAAKPENKLIYMWLLGLFVLCSPTESYSMLVNQTGVDFTCKTEEQWQDSIDFWLKDARYREESTRYLHEYALVHYSDKSLQKKWLNAFEQASIL